MNNTKKQRTRKHYDSIYIYVYIYIYIKRTPPKENSGHPFGPNIPPNAKGMEQLWTGYSLAAGLAFSRNYGSQDKFHFGPRASKIPPPRTLCTSGCLTKYQKKIYSVKPEPQTPWPSHSIGT